jgi:hypothetical protein
MLGYSNLRERAFSGGRLLSMLIVHADAEIEGGYELTDGAIGYWVSSGSGSQAVNWAGRPAALEQPVELSKCTIEAYPVKFHYVSSVVVLILLPATVFVASPFGANHR